MDKYFIDYQTGAGNEEIKGTLNEVKKLAEEGTAFTQKDVIIRNEDGQEVSRLPWYGTEPGEDDIVTCRFGSFGFYGEWWED